MDAETIRPLLVQQEIWEADGILSLILVDPEGGELLPWEPGAHLDVILPSGLIRQYSLSGDFLDHSYYRIGVLLDPSTRGGSKEIHETALIGKMLNVRGPRNHFELHPSERYLFIAGGIGITPIIPMLQKAELAGAPWRLVYGGRSRSTMAFVPEIMKRRGGIVELIPEDEAGYPNLDAELSGLENTLVYSCGPPGLLTALEDRSERMLGPGVLHIERFTAPEHEEYDESENSEFELELVKTGATMTVPSDKTTLRAILDVLPYFMYACEEGYCGTCQATVLEGEPDHRDSCLTDEERAEQHIMMTCVSRSKTPRLVLDL